MGDVIQLRSGGRAQKDKALHDEAFRLGCKPRWYDGILGWRWHCSCEDNDHGYDQQCSVITEESLKNFEKWAKSQGTR